MKAFVLGAGLGTRLQPLTNILPKPLVPFQNKPLVYWGLDHLIKEGVTEVIINTHHLASAWKTYFPDNSYKGIPIHFRHEPQILETAGGISNIEDLIDNEPLIVFNGDLLSNLSLQKHYKEHVSNNREVTLLLRSTGSEKRVVMNEKNQITAIGPEVEDYSGATFQFTGVYIISPQFLKRLTSGKKESVRTIFQNMIATNSLPHGVICDEGYWADLGDRTSYLEAHFNDTFPLPNNEHNIHPSATIDPSASIDEYSLVGANCIVEANAVVRKSVLWPDTKITANASLENCIVSHGEISGDHLNKDF